MQVLVVHRVLVLLQVQVVVLVHRLQVQVVLNYIVQVLLQVQAVVLVHRLQAQVVRNYIVALRVLVQAVAVLLAQAVVQNNLVVVPVVKVREGLVFRQVRQAL